MKLKKLLKTSLLAMIVFSGSSVFSQTFTIDSPRASQYAETMQRIGVTDIKVTYHSPAVRGRKVWGGIVPYGMNPTFTGLTVPWRAGADENTTITFSTEVTIAGTKVPAGTYGLFIETAETGDWTVILSSNSTSWGSFYYRASEDVVRAPAKVTDIPFQENLNYVFLDNTQSSTKLAVQWEKKRAAFDIEINTTELAVADIRNQLRSNASFQWQGWNEAATYCLRNNVNIDEAITWSDVAIRSNKAFGTLSVKAGLLRLKGDNDGADKVMDDAVAIANENQLNNYGYQLMAQGKNDEAVKMLELNTKRNPKSANAFDSLGEAYKAAGNKKKAIKSFKKALSLDPAPNVKANSIKLLGELGEDTSKY